VAVRGVESAHTMKGSALRIFAIAITLIGLADSIYLSVLKFTHQESRCIAGIGDCFTVNTSQYSVIFGIPIAVFGAGAYLVILALLLMESKKGFWEDNAGLGIFGVSLFGVLFSGYLTYLEIAVIHAVCPFCLLSAAAMLILFIISIVRLARPEHEAQSNT
jgi:uncharacterized membrane protein